MADVSEDAHVEEQTYSIRTDQIERMESELDYGDSKAGYVRKCIDLWQHMENPDEVLSEIRNDAADLDEQSSADAVDNEAD